MDLVTISSVSKRLDISTRTLRYYEEVGLIKSDKMPDYSYRAYSMDTINKIRQIVFLRKLSLSLKQIKAIYENDDAKYALQIFAQKIDEIDREVDGLNSVKSVIEMLIENFKHSVELDFDKHLLSDNNVIEILNSISSEPKQLKEKKQMEDVKKVSQKKDEISDVRIIYLPPTTVASSQYKGPEPENHAGAALDKFVKDSKLTDVKPNLRVYGFNNPNPQGDEEYGYEFWVTIPDDMEVSAPLKKKTFAGGMYAAYCIKMGDFHLWQGFFEWVMKSEQYDYDAREPLPMGGTMEEHLNAFGYYTNENNGRGYIQLDLLIPIKEK